jgi:hypothetical protein
MLVALHVVGIAVVPLKVTVLVPCVAPKLTPATVTGAPAGLDGGDTFVMLGATVKATPLLGWPFTVTVTAPVVAPAGTGAVMLVALQVVGDVMVPLNLNVLVPCVAPKSEPVIIAGAATAPSVGARFAIVGGTVTEAGTVARLPANRDDDVPEVAPTGTCTAMLVALHVVGVAVVG